MPRPVFIICSQGSSIDKSTNALSIFGVLEGFTTHFGDFTEIAERVGVASIAGGGPIAATFNMNCVWMRTDHEPVDEEYEYEVLLHAPSEEPRKIGGKCFKIEKRFFRITAHVVRGNPWTVQGIAQVECRVRRVAGGRWVSQEFPIPITVVGEAPPVIQDAGSIS